MDEGKGSSSVISNKMAGKRMPITYANRTKSIMFQNDEP
jgi:hypothetical protein